MFPKVDPLGGTTDLQSLDREEKCIEQCDTANALPTLAIDATNFAFFFLLPWGSGLAVRVIIPATQKTVSNYGVISLGIWAVIHEADKKGEF